MDFLSGLGSLAHNVGNFFGGVGNFLFGGGGNDDEERRRRQQQQQQAAQNSAPRQQSQPQAFGSASPQQTQQPTLQAPKKAVNLFQAPDNALQPAQPDNALPTFANGALQKAPQTPQFAPTARPASQVPQHTLIDAGKDLGDVSGIALRKASRGFIGDIANVANTAGTLMGDAHYNPQEIQKRTNDFLDTIGLTENGKNGLNSNVDYNNEAAKRVGEIAGTVMGEAPAVAAQVASGGVAGNALRVLPAVEKLAGSGVLGNIAAKSLESVGSGLPATAIGQATNPNQTAKDALINTGLDFGLGALGGAVSRTTHTLPGEVAPGVASVNPNQEADAVQQTLQKATQNAQMQAAPQETQALQKAPTQAAPAQSVTPTQIALPTEAPIVPQAAQTAEVQQPIQQPLQPAEVTIQPQMPVSANAVMAPNAPNIRAGLVKNLGDIADSVSKSGSTHEVLSNDALDQAAKNVIANMSDEDLVNAYKNGANFSNNVADTALGANALQRLKVLAKNGDEDAKQAIEHILTGAETAQSGSGRQLNYGQTLFDKLPSEVKSSMIIRNIDKARDEIGLPRIADTKELEAEIDGELTNYFNKGETLNEKMSQNADELQQLMDKARTGAGTSTAEDIARAKQLRSANADLELAIEKNQGDLAKYYDTLVPTKATTQKNVGDLARTMMLSSVSSRLNDPLTTGFSVLDTLGKMTGESVLGKIGNAVTGTPGKFISKIPSVRTLAKGSAQALKKTAGEFNGNTYVGGDLQKMLRGGNAGTGETRTGLARSNKLMDKIGLGGVRNAVRAGAEAATNLSAGVRDVQAERLAAQEAAQAGLKGVDRDLFIQSRMGTPTRTMKDNIEQLHQEVNNLNDNPLTKGLEKLSNGMTHIPVVGETIKNLTLPFTRWTGGQMWNNVTDKNAIASVVKIANAFRKGDPQAVVKNSAALAQNFAAGATLGYGLAKSGVLTDQDAQGYNDGGVYLHIGDHYIPASFFSFFAPNIIMGYATYKAFNDPSKQSTADKLTGAVGNTMQESWNAFSGNSLIGQDNPVLTSLNNWAQGKNGVTGQDTLATIGSQAAGQFIPAAASDVNAVLNNHTALNPTKEASDIKATKLNPATGNMVKDTGQTAVNQLLNKIPFVSQNFPRKAGVAAPGLIDRVVRGGSRDTSATVQKAADTKAAEDHAALFKKNDIPDPDNKTKGYSFVNAVETKIENGDFDKARQGLEAELKNEQADKTMPPSKIKATQDKIAQLKVASDNKLSYEDMKLYNSTNLTDWRNMGDPKKDSYDQATYEKLWKIDQLLSDKGVAGSFSTVTGSTGKLTGDKQKYSEKAASTKKSGSGSRGGSASAKNQAGGTISPVDLKAVTLGKLAPQKIQNAPIPTIAPLKVGDLPKKRQISVSKAK